MTGKKFLAGAIFLMVTGALAISPLQFAEREITAGADDEYASLANEINQILQDERLDGALAGVGIREAETRVWFQLRIPSSSLPQQLLKL